MTNHINTNDGKSCPYCVGMVFHFGGVCPKVKAFEYYKDGTIKRVEFFDVNQLTNKAKSGEVSPVCIKCKKSTHECECGT